MRVLVQADADRAPASALARAIGAALVDPGSMAQYVRELGRCQAVVTARFHSAIFALVTGAVPIGLHADALGHKMPGLFELLGAPELALPFDADAALEALAQVRAERPGLGAELAERASALRDTTVAAVSAAL